MPFAFDQQNSNYVFIIINEGNEKNLWSIIFIQLIFQEKNYTKALFEIKKKINAYI